MSGIKICDIKQSKNKHYNDYRATVGGLKEALKDLDDDLNIGVRYGGGYAYTDLNEILLVVDKDLVIINGD